MHTEIQLIWQEVLADIATPVGAWQLGVIVIAVAIAWLINDMLRAYVLRQVQHHHTIEDTKLAIGGINRVLFPLSTLLLVSLGRLLLAHWQHVSMLDLVNRLLIAMAAIRLLVYAVRYIVSPGGWLKTLEKFIAWLIWGALALHLTGYLNDLIALLAGAEFNIGKTTVNLLMLTQALITVLVTLLVALWLSKFLEKKILQADHVSMNMRVVLVKLIRIIFITVAILIALSAVGLDITVLSVFGGALGVGLGFGLQKIASNYVSGFIILLDKSMQIGDVITAESHYGVVTDLRSRYLVLRKLDGTEVVIPNETFITSSVINHSFTDRKARVQLPIQISYESDLEQAMAIMHAATRGHSRILAEPAPSVHIIGFGESGIDLNLNIWIPDPEEGTMELKSMVYLSIWHAFKQHGIVIPYPQREIRIMNEAINLKND